MKRSIALLLALLVALVAVMPAHCQDPVSKLKRGTANALSSFYEIPYRVTHAKETEGYTNTTAYAVIEGACNTLTQMAAGVCEVGTFLIPIPADYKPMIKDPEYFAPKDCKGCTQ